MAPDDVPRYCPDCKKLLVVPYPGDYWACAICMWRGSLRKVDSVAAPLESTEATIETLSERKRKKK